MSIYSSTASSPVISDTGPIPDIPRTIHFNGAAHAQPPGARPATTETKPTSEPARIGHNSAAQPSTGPAKRAEPTIYQQIEAVLDCNKYSAQQKCIILKIRCRVDGKTLTGALISNAGLMQAASIADWRTLRAELRELEGKSRAIPKDENKGPVEDPIDSERALVIREERSGKATTFALTPERLQAIISAYMEFRQKKGTAARPPASGAGGALDVPPASHAPHPLHAVQGDPLHPMQTDPFPSSIDPNKKGADAPKLPLAEPTKRAPAKPKATEVQFERFWATYPKREGKAEARKNLLALTRDDAELAIAGAEAYARKCRGEGKDPKYIKWPQGWLSERRFEDYTAPSASAATPTLPAFWWGNPAALRAMDKPGWFTLIGAHGAHGANGTWSVEMLGPAPGSPGCVVPADVIRELRLGKGDS